jgi:hypothetical protein
MNYKSDYKDFFSKPMIGSKSQLLFYKILFSYYQRIHLENPNSISFRVFYFCAPGSLVVLSFFPSRLTFPQFSPRSSLKPLADRRVAVWSEAIDRYR